MRKISIVSIGSFLLVLFSAATGYSVWPPSTLLEEAPPAASSDNTAKPPVIQIRTHAIVEKLNQDERELAAVLQKLKEDENEFHEQRASKEKIPSPSVSIEEDQNGHSLH